MSKFFKSLSFRHYFAVFGTLIALCVLFGTSPGANLIRVPFGADVISKLSSLPAMVFGVLALFISTKALFDYLDLGKITDKACETAEGAGYVLIAVSITRVAIALVVMGMISTFS